MFRMMERMAGRLHLHARSALCGFVATTGQWALHDDGLVEPAGCVWTLLLQSESRVTLFSTPTF